MEMGGQEGTSNGDPEWLKREELTNGFGVVIEHEIVDGNSGQSEGFRTYKRRKHARSSSEGKGFEDWTTSTENATKFSDQNLRNLVLEHLYQSLSDDEGGIRGCIEGALVFRSEIDCATTVKGSDTLDGDKNRCSESGIPNGIRYSTKGHVGIIPDGQFNESDHHINSDRCKRALLDILTSEKFTLLCKVLLENFQGIKVDRLFDLNAINSKMKRGAYENSPMLFVADIQQMWRKLEDIGAEIITLAKNLSQLTRNSYNEHVGGSTHCTFDEGKNVLFTRYPDSDVKVEQTVACNAYKVRTCRHCEEKADEKDCLVCDSCEEMYHVSCIEPAVKEIPRKSWYCAGCTAKGIGSPHDNCVVCERLNDCASRSRINQAGNDTCPTNGEMSIDCQDKSKSSGDDDYICKICGGKILSDDKCKSCSHPFCYNKLYHVRCLTPRQLKHYGPQWYCPSCLCRVCLTDRDDTKIVLCDGCDQAYHIYCMDPPRKSVPTGQWYCRKCDAGLQEIYRVKRAYENKLKRKCEEESDKSSRGGMDMLLNAARTLNFLKESCN